MSNDKIYPHYFKQLPAGTTHVDVYLLLDLYKVHNAAVAHAVKKLLCAGGRGAKDMRQDLVEARDSIQRALDIIDGTKDFLGVALAQMEIHHGPTPTITIGGEQVDIAAIYKARAAEQDAKIKPLKTPSAALSAMADDEKEDAGSRGAVKSLSAQGYCDLPGRGY